ncbi:hypothetical protein GY539_005070, partial [Escherichia coli]|nr:hypothetical protein [Salmonella enterica subsp. enterica serovar 4,[5],12:i:-]EFI5416783.1 hypothetical protein [Escherichia coli]
KWVDCHCCSSPSSLMLMYAYISINDGALKYHWYNLVKNILRMRTYHVVTQLCT